MDWQSLIDALVAGMQERGMDWRVVVGALAATCILPCIVYGVRRSKKQAGKSGDRWRSRSGAEIDVLQSEKCWQIWKEEARKEAYAVRSTVFAFQSHYSVTTPLKALQLDGQQRACTFDGAATLPKIEGGYWVPLNGPGRYRRCDIDVDLAGDAQAMQEYKAFLIALRRAFETDGAFTEKIARVKALENNPDYRDWYGKTEAFYAYRSAMFPEVVLWQTFAQQLGCEPLQAASLIEGGHDSLEAVANAELAAMKKLPRFSPKSALATINTARRKLDLPLLEP